MCELTEILGAVERGDRQASERPLPLVYDEHCDGPAGPSGLPIERVAEMIGVSRATAYRQGSFARAWLRSAMDESDAT